jgi:hypothetical protein
MLLFLEFFQEQSEFPRPPLVLEIGKQTRLLLHTQKQNPLAPRAYAHTMLTVKYFLASLFLCT